MSRISFPFSVADGRLAISDTLQSGQEALFALLNIHTGELPMNRDYGADLTYNIPLEVARAQQARIQQQVSIYHSNIQLKVVEAVLSSDGTVVDWITEAVVV